MNQLIHDKSISKHGKHLLSFLAAFFTLRIFSWLLVEHPIVQSIIVFCLVMYVGLLYFKNPTLAWKLLLAELVLGGAGHYLELWTLSLRTLLIYTFLFLWVVHSLYKRAYNRLHIPHKIFYVVAPLFLFAVFGAIIGIVNDHPFRQVLADFIPFSYLFLLLPAYHLFDIHKHNPSEHYLIELGLSFIIGSAIYSLIIFCLFAFGIEHIHDPFYNWIRDVGAGKITDMQNGFFRIVFPEHLLLPIGMLIISSFLMRPFKQKSIWYIALLCSILVLVLNLSRAYMLGISLAFFILLYRHKLQHWLRIGFINIFLFIGLFIGLNILASAGQSLGLELLGIRTQSVWQPHIEESSYTRMNLLPAIQQQIIAAPIVGNGLASTITFFHPITQEHITTYQFDWGYFEFWAELGIFGLLNLLILLIFLLTENYRHIRHCTSFPDLHVGLLAAIISLMIIALFGPVFMHSLGILLLVFFVTIVAKTPTTFDHIAQVLLNLLHPHTTKNPLN